MAENKTTFPRIPVKQWWILRAKFKQSIPPKVSASYLATALSMTEASAKGNIIPSLVAFKIIDVDEKQMSVRNNGEMMRNIQNFARNLLMKPILKI